MTNIDNSPNVLYIGQQCSIERTETFAEWMNGSKDTVGKGRMLKGIKRLSDGNFGDVKSVGEGVFEMRFHFGPGYRVYYTVHGGAIIILLCGGDKDNQARDIEQAKVMAKELMDGNNDETL